MFRSLGHFGLELAVRHDLVDQPPLQRALALDAFLDGAEIVGVIAAYLALVDHAGQPASAGQHGKQRQFWQRHRRRTIVGEHDVIGRQRQLIAASGRGPVDHANKALPRVRAGILQPVAGLIGELAEVDLVGMRGARKHADVGAGAEHPVFRRTQHHHLDAGMLEPEPLHGVRQFDIDAKVIGIQLELITFEQAAILVDIHRQRRHLTVDGKLPVPVAGRLGLEIDVPGAASEDAIFSGHGPSSPVLSLPENMHNNACLPSRPA